MFGTSYTSAIRFIVTFPIGTRMNPKGGYKILNESTKHVIFNSNEIYTLRGALILNKNKKFRNFCNPPP